MTSQQLPDHPSLEQLKKQAKSLLHAARTRDRGALERFRALPSFSHQSTAALGAMRLALHDAQSVIAREHGFKSWRDLREHVEEQTLSFSGAVDTFIRCATGSAPARALRLLALHPGIAHANLYAELVLGDCEAVAERLRKHPDAARHAGGAQNWEPLLYTCHTCVHESVPKRTAGLVSTARELLARGANPNAAYHWNWHAELPRTALWGALCAVNHLPLAEVLLDAGANPTDGVSAHICAGQGNTAALDLLHRFGMDVNGISGGVPPLRYILGWAYNADARGAGIRWLLEHGADPNLPWGGLDEAPIHVAAQRWNVSLVELLVRFGADIHRPRADGLTAHTLAALHGNADIAAWLLAHGARDELSPLERFIAACARGDRARATTMLNEEPALRSGLRAEHHLMLHVHAERGDVAVIDTLLACGFDAAAHDSDGVTPLHRAAMFGHAEAVRALLAHGAPVNALDGMFAGTPLVWAAQGWSQGPRENRDYLGVAHQLMAAGSPLEWEAPERAPDPERMHEQLAELCRAAAKSAS